MVGLMDIINLVEIDKMIKDFKRRCILYNMDCCCGKVLKNTEKGLEGLHLLQL